MSKWFYTGILAAIGLILAVLSLAVTPEGKGVLAEMGRGLGAALAGLKTVGLGFIFFSFPAVMGHQFRKRVVRWLDKFWMPSKPFSFFEHALLALVFSLAAGGLQLVWMEIASANESLLSVFVTLGIPSYAWFFYGLGVFLLGYSLLLASKK